jgi:hypothetical protein
MAMAKTITVPKTPKSAYNPGRKISSLLKAHVANLEAVTRRRGAPASSKKKPKTEAQASAYIAEMTQQIHPPGPTAPTPAAPQTVGTPPVPPYTRPTRRKRRKKARRAGAKK